MSTILRLAHLSDPHFGTISFLPSQFLSKRWIGNLNLILLRNQFYHITPLFHLPDLFTSLQVDFISITGDFTTTSLEEEFSEAFDFVKLFKEPIFFLPGNHDYYTRDAEKRKLFYHYFADQQGEFGLSLSKDRLFVKKMKNGWWWVGLDCAIATPPFCAYGEFFPEMEKKLDDLLTKIPHDERVIMGNHFPLFTSKKPRHDLRGSASLQRILQKHSHVKLYLHGHDHHPYIIDRREKGFPLVFNCGSCARKKGGGFTLYELDDQECRFKRYSLKKQKKNLAIFSWEVELEDRFTL